MPINPLYVPPAPPPVASTPVEPTTTTTTTTVSPETEMMVVAFHNTQMAIASVTDVSDELEVVGARLETIETLVEKLCEDLVGVPKVYVSHAYTAEQQAADLLAQAQQTAYLNGQGPKPVTTPYTGQASAPASAPAAPLINHLGNTYNNP